MINEDLTTLRPEFWLEYNEFQDNDQGLVPGKSYNDIILCLLILQSRNIHSFIISDHELKKCENVFRNLLDMDPTIIETHFGLSKILFYKNDMKGCLDSIEKCLAGSAGRVD